MKVIKNIEELERIIKEDKNWQCKDIFVFKNEAESVGEYLSGTHPSMRQEILNKINEAKDLEYLYCNSDVVYAFTKEVYEELEKIIKEEYKIKE